MSTSRASASRTRSESPPAVARHWHVALVALSSILALQAMRALFPLSYNLGERANFLAAGLFAIAIFLAPLLAAPIVRWLGIPQALTATVAGVAVLRLALQLLPRPTLAVASAAVAAALVMWTVELMALRGSAGGLRLFAVGLLIGLASDTGLRSAYATWDYVWQGGLIPLGLTLLLCGAALLAAGRARFPSAGRPVEPRFGALLPLALFGPLLMLQFMFLQSPAFAASASATRLAPAVAIVLVGDGLGLVAAMHLSERRPARGVLAPAALLLILLAALLTVAEGAAVALVLVLAQPLAFGLFVAAMANVPEAGDRSASWRSATAVAAGIFLFLLLAFLYQYHYDAPLPISNGALPAVAALLLGLGALRSAPPAAGIRLSRRLVAVPAVLLLVPLGLALTHPTAPSAAPGSPAFRLISYNLHSAVNPNGQLDPEAIARVIEAQRPDVVLLQEVARGWLISAMTDLAEWLSRRLDMPAYVWAPAADGQFGNVLFTRFPMLERDSAALPFGAGPMIRSYARARLDLGGGETVNVFVTHLQHREENTETRLLQIDVLLQGWAGAPRTIIAGDMNAEPQHPEIDRLLDEGFVSAQDAVGDPDLLTAPSNDPDARIDWIFGTSDIVFSDFVIPRTTASDHLPLAVTVTVT